MYDLHRLRRPSRPDQARATSIPPRSTVFDVRFYLPRPRLDLTKRQQAQIVLRLVAARKQIRPMADDSPRNPATARCRLRQAVTDLATESQTFIGRMTRGRWPCLPSSSAGRLSETASIRSTPSPPAPWARHHGLREANRNSQARSNTPSGCSSPRCGPSSTRPPLQVIMPPASASARAGSRMHAQALDSSCSKARQQRTHNHRRLKIAQANTVVNRPSTPVSPVS